MNITEVKIFRLNGNGSTKAMASITIDECFVVTGLKVMEGRNGLFVSMPSRKTKDGEYKDICFPIDRDTRATIQDMVLREYQGDDEPVSGHGYDAEPIPGHMYYAEEDDELPF